MLLLACVFTACSDKDDYTINTADIITTITTGDATTVYGTAATLTGTVKDLSQASSSSYKVGVSYATTAEGVQSGTKVAGTIADDGTVTTSLSGLTEGVTYYYCTYVTMQGMVTKYGDVKSFVTTDSGVATADPIYTEVTADLSATVKVSALAADKVERGILISNDEATVKEGRLYASESDASGFTINIKGLLPNQTYYYVAYASVNGAKHYGEVKSFKTPAQKVEFVDLGLSVEWATVNVGAMTPTEVGGLYGFGDNTLFNTSESADDYCATDYQSSENDLAAMCIDGAFTPSADQITELLTSTTQTSETVDGIPGTRFTAANGNSIFLPVTGVRLGTETSSEAQLGAYWSSSIDVADANYGSSLAFNAGETASLKGTHRAKGLAIRAVRMPNRPMNLDYLCQEWSIDLNELGKSAVFDGPLYYYGTADNWNSVTNGYKISGDSWSWCADWPNNSWICEAKDRGTMEFKKDGTVVVNDLGNNKQYSGTYTVDTENHTISLSGAQILHLENFDAIVSNWSTNLRVMSLTEHGLQIAALRDQSSEGECLLVHNYASSSLVGGNGSQADFNNDCLKWGDLEGKGNLRLELYNEWGSTHDNPGFNKDGFTFNKNMAVTFKLTGITGNLRDGAVGQYNATLGFADSSWGTQYWGETAKQNALVTGDGEYTVWMEASQTSSGTMVFVIDCNGLASDIVDMNAVKAEIVSITTDQNEDKLVKYISVDNSKILFNNKDGNGTDGRIEIYNEYSDTKSNPGVSQSDISFNGRMAINFTIEGITGNLVDGASADYKADISYAAASWAPSYWGGGIGTAAVTGDGTYTVYADMGTDDAEGAVVWCIELYGLWKDLVDTSKVKVTINEIATEPKK